MLRKRLSQVPDYGVVITVFGLALAGAESLRVLAVGDASAGTFDVAVGGLAAGGTALVLAALVGHDPDFASGGARSQER